MDEPDRPLCECHGEAKLWHKDARRKAGGCWRCAVKRRASNARWREANPGAGAASKRRWLAANPEKKRESDQRRYWSNPEKNRETSLCRYHAPRGGWRTRRLRVLAAQRGRILDQLAELEGSEA